MDVAGRRGARTSWAPGFQEGAWPNPRGRAVAVAEKQDCPGHAAASLPRPGKQRARESACLSQPALFSLVASYWPNTQRS